jgi:hypothetical protein
MDISGIDLIVKAILFVEKQKNISSVKRKLRMPPTMKKTHVDLMRSLKRENAVNLGRKGDYPVSPKAQKLSKFLLEEVEIPSFPLD